MSNLLQQLTSERAHRAEVEAKSSELSTSLLKLAEEVRRKEGDAKRLRTELRGRDEELESVQDRVASALEDVMRHEKARAAAVSQQRVLEKRVGELIKENAQMVKVSKMPEQSARR